MFGLGLGELALIFGILLLLFGGRKLPEIAKMHSLHIKNIENSIECKKSL